MNERTQNFLSELKELSNKYGIYIDTCNNQGITSLYDVQHNTFNELDASYSPRVDKWYYLIGETENGY